MVGFFKLISTLFLGESQETSNACNSVAVEPDMLRINNADIKLIIAKIAGAMGGNPTLASKELLLLSNDALDVSRYRSEDFMEELKRQLANRLGDGFGRITADSNIEEHHEASKLKDGLYIVINEIDDADNASERRACLSAIEGYGSLALPEVVLDREGTYNIGIGERTKLDNGALRINQIAVSDNPDDPQYNNNKFVSRAHAHITYTHKEGWLLYVELSGTRIMNKRTRIQRNGQFIDMLSPIIPQKLKDGDIIELSKTVLISFNLKN